VTLRGSGTRPHVPKVIIIIIIGVATAFGVSINMYNAVQHDITHVFATATDGSGMTVTLHTVDHLSMSASYQVTSFMGCH
jgi:hypothetical protein